MIAYSVKDRGFVYPETISTANNNQLRTKSAGYGVKIVFPLGLKLQQVDSCFSEINKHKN